MSISKNMLAADRTPVAAGEYTLEITNMRDWTSDDKRTRKAQFFCEVAEPLANAGKKVFFSTWYDKFIVVFLEKAGHSLDEVFGSSETIDEEKLFGLLKGRFFKVRLGVKNGYNELVEVLDCTDNEPQL